MFFFFFEQLYYVYDIHKAFKMICLDKILYDGYFDMSMYIFGRIRKDDIYAKLKAEKSRYAVLYEESYPKFDVAYEKWASNFCSTLSEKEDYDLTYSEAQAIVNWIYRCIKSSEERIKFTVQLFEYIKELHHIKNKIEYQDGVFYNKSKVEVHFFSSISGISKFVSSISVRNKHLFFRGHSQANYMLIPSVMRTKALTESESKMYHELLINCPTDFEKCQTHLEKLVEMQHYGLPTRLLDITKNLLVALYFACESFHEVYGEVVLLTTKSENIKYPQSDIVSILASLPAFSYSKQREFYQWAKDPYIDNYEFNKLASRLVREVQLEKPAFLAEINKDDVLRSFIVYALKNNNRIIKQDGAFVLCGLEESPSSLQEFRYQSNKKKIVVLIKNKKEILRQLDTFSIIRATLFPEIDCVAEYIRSKYD